MEEDCNGSYHEPNIEDDYSVDSLGVRYHLKEYSIRELKNAQKLFNLWHASPRNAIEREFGVLKKGFAIIASSTEPQYTFDAQRDVFVACCILHNFLMSIDPDEELIADVDRELLNSRRRLRRNAIDEDTEEGKVIRDNIAAQMWKAYNSSGFEWDSESKLFLAKYVKP
ncbi:uncharacterized protein LOC130824982 [Amaranthus tricolor]|uniref:uncharacterized protein LOC130824982 n=1 Tax=Amaranthus tricolor TaxID=29722 RepID=UPI00258679E6|nr:uncharacterized protein LOC130824982 [Amaranthus tricolor]